MSTTKATTSMVATTIEPAAATAGTSTIVLVARSSVVGRQEAVRSTSGAV
jgi:hypothetical protein